MVEKFPYRVQVNHLSIMSQRTKIYVSYDLGHSLEKSL